MKSPRALIGATVIAGIIGVTGGAALATRSASDHFADKALSRLGGDSDEILDKLADKLVDKLSEEGGTLDETQAQLVDELAGVAGAKLDGVDAEQLLDDVRGDVVAAGMGKLNEISVDAIVEQVTTALIASAESEIEDIDVNKLVKEIVNDLAKDIDLEKIVKDELAKVDVEGLVLKAVQQQMGGGGSGSGSGSIWSLFGDN
jgi:hypothetical protein